MYMYQIYRNQAYNFKQDFAFFSSIILLESSIINITILMGNKQRQTNAAIEEIEENFVDEKIIFKEEPFMIEDVELMRSVQHRSIGGIKFLTKKMQFGVGSGVLISKNLVLTAAHNIYDKEYECENSELKFYAGANGAAENFYEAQGWKYPQQFKSCPNNMRRLQFDYALIKLKDNDKCPIDYKEFPELTPPCDICFKEKRKQVNLEIFGYPLHRQNYRPLDKYGSKIMLQQFGLARANRIVELNPDQSKMSYAISTLPGHSGSPIFAEGSIIAIHNGGGKKSEEFNIGRLMSFSLLEDLKEWGKQLNGNSFQINLCSHLQAQLQLFPSKNPRRMHESIKLKLQKNKAEEKLSFYNSYLVAIDVTKHTNLKWLDLGENKLEAIDLRTNVLLTYLRLQNNQIRAIDLSTNINLIDLDLSSNQLTTINLTSNKSLNLLCIDFNQLEAIDLASNLNLTRLSLYKNKLTAIDLKPNIKLFDLQLSINKLTTIDLQTNIALNSLRINSNQLATIDLQKNTNLASLFIDYNQLEAINLSKNSKIIILYMKKNRLQRMVCCFSRQLYELEMQYQRSLSCELLLLHRKEDAKACKSWGQSRISQYHMKDIVLHEFESKTAQRSSNGSNSAVSFQLPKDPYKKYSLKMEERP